MNRDHESAGAASEYEEGELPTRKRLTRSGIERSEFDALAQIVNGLQRDVSSLKRDVSSLKRDVSGLKRDVGALIFDSRGLANDVRTLTRRSRETQQQMPQGGPARFDPRPRDAGTEAAGAGVPDFFPGKGGGHQGGSGFDAGTDIPKFSPRGAVTVGDACPGGPAGGPYGVRDGGGESPRGHTYGGNSGGGAFGQPGMPPPHAMSGSGGRGHTFEQVTMQPNLAAQYANEQSMKSWQSGKARAHMIISGGEAHYSGQDEMQGYLHSVVDVTDAVFEQLDGNLGYDFLRFAPPGAGTLALPLEKHLSLFGQAIVALAKRARTRPEDKAAANSRICALTEALRIGVHLLDQHTTMFYVTMQSPANRLRVATFVARDLVEYSRAIHDRGALLHAKFSQAPPAVDDFGPAVVPTWQNLRAYLNGGGIAHVESPPAADSAGPTKGGFAPASSKCRRWEKNGECRYGQECKFVASHNDTNKRRRRGESSTAVVQKIKKLPKPSAGGNANVGPMGGGAWTADGTPG